MKRWRVKLATLLIIKLAVRGREIRSCHVASLSKTNKKRRRIAAHAARESEMAWQWTEAAEGRSGDHPQATGEVPHVHAMWALYQTMHMDADPGGQGGDICMCKCAMQASLCYIYIYIGLFRSNSIRNRKSLTSNSAWIEGADRNHQEMWVLNQSPKLHGYQLVRFRNSMLTCKDGGKSNTVELPNELILAARSMRWLITYYEQRRWQKVAQGFHEHCKVIGSRVSWPDIVSALCHMNNNQTADHSTAGSTDMSFAKATTHRVNWSWQ